MSMLVMTRLLAGKPNLSRTLPLSSRPNTDARMILAEFYVSQKNKQKNEVPMHFTINYNYLCSFN